MKVERIEKAEAATAPADVKLRLELKQARATIRALKRQVRAEQAHASWMLDRMVEMGQLALQRAEEHLCCDPARSDMLRAGRRP